MSKCISQEEIKNILVNIERNKKEILKLHDQILVRNNNIKYMEQVLKDKCKHDKVINHDVISEHTEYYCSICYTNL